MACAIENNVVPVNSILHRDQDVENREFLLSNGWGGAVISAKNMKSFASSKEFKATENLQFSLTRDALNRLIFLFSRLSRGKDILENTEDALTIHNEIDRNPNLAATIQGAKITASVAGYAGYMALLMFL